jgi:nitrite reductase (NADH) small subunit
MTWPADFDQWDLVSGPGKEKRMARIFVCKDGELKDGNVRIITADSAEIGVYRHGGKYYAYRNLCPHQGGPACEGIIMSKVVEVLGADRSFVGEAFDDNEPHIVCPWHGWEFKLETGEHAADAKMRLKRYDIVQQEGAVYVDI